MDSRTRKDLWIEMSVREIWTQCQFARVAYESVLSGTQVGSTDQTFVSIHAFLIHAALVSKLLKGEFENCVIGNILGIPTSSIVHDRKFRNHLEHSDERLKDWILAKDPSINIGSYNIGPKFTAGTNQFIHLSHLDPSSMTYTFADEDFELQTLFDATQEIKRLADEWVGKLSNGTVSRPISC